MNWILHIVVKFIPEHNHKRFVAYLLLLGHYDYETRKFFRRRYYRFKYRNSIDRHLPKD